MAPVSAFRVRPSSISIRDISDIIKRHTLNCVFINSRRPRVGEEKRKKKFSYSGRVVRVTREWEEPLVGRQFVMVKNNLHKGFFAANEFILGRDYWILHTHIQG